MTAFSRAGRKSRKVPTPSPRAGNIFETDDAEGEGNSEGALRNRQREREASPLARMTAKV